ncbi:hypothetical protein D9757_006816 [Collybiopsis confluens]|uniref:F-box domain-containing protein n=1 Tax=Collybiopsis confluens TaxID=2823264 RepID=A0A8H5MB62_9AGAR|nr:hypothetical protein D9757_006816 [Collybiopsis confluens]
MPSASLAFLLFAASLIGLQGHVQSATISSSVAQTFEGIGGSGAWWPHDLYNFPDSVKQNLSSLLFSESGLGISSYRYNLGGGGVNVSNPVRAPETPYVSAGVYNFSADPQGIYFLQQASNLGVPILTMFVNSPPAALTSNGASCDGFYVSGSGGAFATYMVDVAEHWREAGINISYISPMNEPDNGFGPIPCGQEGMVVLPTQRAEVINDLWDELDSRGLTGSIGILGDETSWLIEAVPEYPFWLPQVESKVAHVVHHTYDFPSDLGYTAFIDVLKLFTSKPSWMTEVCCSLGSPDGSGKGFSGGYDPTINNALMFSGMVFQSINIGGESHYDFWTLVSNGIGCSPLNNDTCTSTPNPNGFTDGMIYYDADYATNGNFELYLVKHFWTFKHFGNFVKRLSTLDRWPGNQRHPLSGSDASEYTLVVSNSTSYNVIAMNPEATDSTLSLTFPETVCATTAFRTSAEEDFATIQAATGGGSSWSLPLSATSLTTVGDHDAAGVFFQTTTMQNHSDSDAANFLEIFPHEIVLRVLLQLDPVSLARCQMVCKFLHDTITESVSLVYTLELAISHQEDGHSSNLSAQEKLDLLRNQQRHWAKLDWGEELRYEMKRGIWELFGNVLAQHDVDQSFIFVQFPSAHRNIAERTWTVKPEIQGIAQDFVIDPTQDLFILIEIPPLPPIETLSATHPTYHIHILTMSTATKHPLAADSGMLYHDRSLPHLASYSMQISGDFVGILFYANGLLQNEFIIWGWKTGEKKLHLTGDQLLSFSFLSERHILFSTTTVRNACELLIVDFMEEGGERLAFNNITHGVKLAIPTLALHVSPVKFIIRSDPSPDWAPHSDLQIPFHVSHGSEKIFVASLWLHKSAFRHLTLIFTRSALFSHLDAMGPISGSPAVPWEDWGPHSTRINVSYRISSTFDSWACYTYGTKLVLPEQSRRTSDKFIVHLFDFNHRALQKDISEGGILADESVSNIEEVECESRLCVTAPSVSRSGDLFRDEVKTWLPYHWIAKTIPDAQDLSSSMMCSEDSVIVVDVSERSACYRVFTF